MKSGSTAVAISWLTSERNVASTIPKTVRLIQRREVIAGFEIIGYRWSDVYGPFKSLKISVRAFCLCWSKIKQAREKSDT